MCNLLLMGYFFPLARRTTSEEPGFCFTKSRRRSCSILFEIVTVTEFAFSEVTSSSPRMSRTMICLPRSSSMANSPMTLTTAPSMRRCLLAATRLGNITQRRLLKRSDTEKRYISSSFLV